MNKALKILLIIALFYKTAIANSLDVIGAVNFIYRNFSDCAKSPTPIKLKIFPRWYNKTIQVLDGEFETPITFGDNLIATASADILLREKWVHAANMPEMTVCRWFRAYLGPVRGNVMMSLGLPPDTCPVPKGHYHSKNSYIDWKSTRIPAFPYGIFKVRLIFTEKATRVMQTCLDIELENKAPEL